MAPIIGVLLRYRDFLKNAPICSNNRSTIQKLLFRRVPPSKKNEIKFVKSKYHQFGRIIAIRFLTNAPIVSQFLMFFRKCSDFAPIFNPFCMYSDLQKSFTNSPDAKRKPIIAKRKPIKCKTKTNKRKTKTKTNNPAV